MISTFAGTGDSLRNSCDGKHTYQMRTLVSFVVFFSIWRTLSLLSLLLSGFQQVTSGPDAGAFCNPLFLRDEPDLCHQISSSKPPRLKSPKRKSLPSEKSYDTTSIPSIPCSDGDMQETSESTTTNEVMGATTTTEEVFTYKTNDAVVACIRDQNVISDALRRRDEEELIRAARSVLYANYLQALASSSPPTFE